MFISKRKLQQLLVKSKYDGYGKGYESGREDGEKEGYSKGLHKGLTTDKQGVLYNQNGIYQFGDDINKEVIRAYVNEQNAIDESIKTF
ncbi:hypothetical protein J11TS1_37360 [Oceanobacillus sp. J11TS1]|nr:hypothetical protein J11TS1_37360 [Oceanobacillus sp. J11TS1]